MLPLTTQLTKLLDSTTDSALIAIFAFIVVGFVFALIAEQNKKG